MFNWFSRSSKSAAATRAAARGRQPRPLRRAVAAHGHAQAGLVEPGLVPAGLAPAGLQQACDPQALARLPDCARQLSPDVQRILAQLPPSIDLSRSCSRYPQAVEKLLKHWRNPAEFRLALDAMLMDSRGGRQGFPFDIVSEFSALREYYDSYVSPIRTSGWGAAPIR
jgi:hypothetical protein